MPSSPLNTEVRSGDKSGRGVNLILGNPDPGYCKKFSAMDRFPLSPGSAQDRFHCILQAFVVIYSCVACQ